MKNHKYTPQYKRSGGKWNGMISLYSIPTGLILVGLYHHVLKFCDDHKIQVVSEYEPTNNNLDLDDVIGYVDSLNAHSDGKKLVARDYQLSAIFHCLRYGRALVLSPTSSGKSFILYCLILAYIAKGKKILLVVPSTMLANQMQKDFMDYSSHNNFDVSKFSTTAYYGAEKAYDKQLVISTWQTAYKLDPHFLSTFDVILGDEAHLYSSKEISGLVKACTKADVRIGMTGTLTGEKLATIHLQGVFGPIQRMITIRDLIDRGEVAKINLHAKVLRYDPKTYNSVDLTVYKTELDWIVNNEARQHYVVDLAGECKGNTIVLFNFVAHGKSMYEHAKKTLKGKNVVFISGDVKLDERENIKVMFKTEKNLVLFATYGTFSTGISIKQIHNIVLASPTKSPVRLWQSIGRGLRMIDNKLSVNVFDLSDNLTKSKIPNHTYKHAKIRAEMYESEKIAFDITEVRCK